MQLNDHPVPFRGMDKWGVGQADAVMDVGWYENEVNERSVAKRKAQYGDSDSFSICDFELGPFSV